MRFGRYIVGLPSDPKPQYSRPNTGAKNNKEASVEHESDEGTDRLEEE